MAAETQSARARLWQQFTNEGLDAFESVIREDINAGPGKTWVPFARHACDRFLMSLRVTNEQWVTAECRLTDRWRQRQLVAEKNISTALVLLDDVDAATHFMQAACHTLEELLTSTGRTDWICAMDGDMQRLVVCLGVRTSQRDRPMRTPGGAATAVRALLCAPGRCDVVSPV